MPKSKPIHELKLTVDNFEGEWIVKGGKTYDYRIKLRKGGGEWNKDLSGWMFRSDPSSLIQEVNNEIQEEADRRHRERQERGRQLSKAKAAKAEFLKRRAEEKAEWERLWNDPVSRAEIDRVTQEITSKRGVQGFWPLDAASPFCGCGAHVFWTLYLKSEKDIEKASKAYHMACPSCYRDYTR